MFCSPKARERLVALLPGAVYLTGKITGANLSELISALRPELILTGWSTPGLPEHCPELRYVCHLGGSVRSKVRRSHLLNNVAVTNWGDCVNESVAEAALMLILSALRRSHAFAQLMHVKRGWTRPPFDTETLFDRRVGIHGFGAIARTLIGLLKPFRTKITAFSEGVPAQLFHEYNVDRASSLDDLFASSEILVEAEALTPATRGQVDERRLRLLRRGATFVNIGRGALVDEDALERAAVDGHLRIGLDVYANEPLPDLSRLRGLENVVLFPHAGGPVDADYFRCGDFAVENIERFLRKEPLRAQMTPEIYDRST